MENRSGAAITAGTASAENAAVLREAMLDLVQQDDSGGHARGCHAPIDVFAGGRQPGAATERSAPTS